MRKLLILMLVIAVLCGTAAAYETPKDFSDMTLGEAMEEFMAYYQLTENNFSISFYNTVTGESYDFNENKFSIAASTYKLPLNMYFYEMEQAGEIASDEHFLWTGMTLSEVHRQSILFSNNEVSEAMAGYWNNYYIYKENMRKYSSMPAEEIDEYYYLTNASCTRMMMDTLKYLYENSEKFEDLIGYMKEAVPGQYFKAGVQEYEIAHKYGEVDEFVNDVAIIYTPQPILLAVYTQGIYGAGVCAQAARLVTDYTVWQAEHSASPEVPEQAEVTEVPEQTGETEISKTVSATVEEDPEPTEEVVQPSEELPEEEPETELSEEEAMEEALRQKQEAAARRQRKKTLTWSCVGIVSLLVVVCLPLAMRKRV